jgi:rod shape-determining protein MreD
MERRMRTDPAAWLIIPSTLLAALVLELLPWPDLLDPWQPPWLLLTVLFWAIRRPDTVGMSIAWIAGLILDVALGSPLGTHALLFTLATTMTLVAQRMLLALSMIQQALWVAFLTLLQQAFLLLMDGHASAEKLMLMSLAPALSALLAWPVINIALMNPQRRLERGR